MTPLVTLAAVLGLAVGSFLNVVIYRVPREESIVAPASHCPSCQVPIKHRHNVPVLSWVVLRGRCAGCSAPISVRYPLVEAGTAALFAAVTLHFGISPQLPAYLYLAAIGVALVMIDFDVRRLPDSIVLPSYVVGVLLLMPAGAVDGQWWPAQRALLGMAALFVVFFTLGLVYPHGLSPDDAKLGGLLGLYLGWLSWSAVLVGLLGAFTLAVITALAARKKRPVLPIGACMVSAAVLAVFLAAPVTHWYGSLLTA